jgi:hypothetical protein
VINLLATRSFAWSESILAVLMTLGPFSRGRSFAIAYSLSGWNSFQFE